jgi:Tol biopolymer transport system component
MGLLAAALLAVAQKADDAERMLKAAQNAELVDGNLQRAIEQYKKIAQSGNRALAAKALLRMAECYQKLGDAESKKIYERIVREYRDQKEAVAAAQEKLGTSDAKPLVTRQVWSGDDIDLDGSPSPDGRYLTYVNWKNKGNLAIRDVRTGAARDVTHDNDWSFAENSVFTPDSRNIVYLWYSNARGEYDVRMIPVEGGAPKVLWDREMTASAISRDGKLLAGSVSPSRGVRQAGVLDLETKKFTVLKTFQDVRPDVGNFSPDGHYLVYSAPVGSESEDRNVYVASVDGKQESVVVPAPGSHRKPLFTPDGSRVVFTSNRSSRTDLWSVGVVAGRPVGAPEVLKSDIGSVINLGITLDGSLYFGARMQQTEARTMQLDPATWQVKGEAKRVSDRFVNINASPVWSPDGKSLAYLSNRQSLASGGPGQAVFVIRDTGTGKEREFPVAVRQFATTRAYRWFPDGRSLLITEFAQGPNPRFRRLDLTTGDVAVLFQPPPANQGFWAAPAPDGRGLFWAKRDTSTLDPKSPNKPPMTWLALRNLETGEDTNVARARAWVLPALTLSFDGRHAAFYAFCSEGNTEEQCLWTVPLAGGPHRELRAPKGRFVQGYGIAWTPKGDAVFANIRETVDRDQIWRLPLDRSAPHALAIPFRNPAWPAMNPNGTEIGFTENVNVGHVSVMQNLFPQTQARR